MGGVRRRESAQSRRHTGFIKGLQQDAARTPGVLINDQSKDKVLIEIFT